MNETHFPRHESRYFCLTVFCLLIGMLVIVPVMAESQIVSHISDVLPNESNTKESSVKATGQFLSLKESASTQSVDYSLLVGQYLPMWGTSSENGGSPTPGVTIIFQRSDDGTNWCPIQSVVSGPDGKAWLDKYTESCASLVYYRVVGPDGRASAGSLVQWLPANPPMTCVPVLPCKFKYSITCIENYDNICGGPGKTNCSINGTISECDRFDNRLSRTPNWTRNFYNKDGDVVIQNFGTTDGYPQSLTESTFHIHSGHGTDALHWGLYTYLPLKDYTEVWIVPPPPAAPIPVPVRTGGYIDASMVEKKWGDNTKWVMLDSCHVLADKQWGNAMSTTHGILGFSGVSYVNEKFPDMFLDNAIDKKMTIVDAFQLTTSTLFDNTSAVAIIKSKNMSKDQFPGIGFMAPDGDANTQPIYIEWPCNARGSST